MTDTHTKPNSSQESFPPAQKSMPPAIKVMNFETALNELQGIVSQLEKGEVQLEDALNFYERASFLRTHCENKLHDAQLKVEQFNKK